MKLTFNTGRLYQKDGQIITMQVLDDRTLFMDHSRGIAGEIADVPGLGVDMPQWLMDHYDCNQYQMSVEAMALERKPDVISRRL